MHTNQTSMSTRIKVGIFTFLAIALIGGISVYVNDRPYWWRSCQLRNINVEDATGLKMKSPVRSLGIEIGFIEEIELFETHVRLGICITAPVEVLPTTRAYLKGEGFLGDKFVELRPVRYVGDKASPSATPSVPASPSPNSKSNPLEPQDGVPVNPTSQMRLLPAPLLALGLLAQSEALAQTSSAPPAAAPNGGKEIPVGSSQDMTEMLQSVDKLVDQMNNLTSTLNEAINPKELRQTMQQLNKTLENASRTLSPESGLNSTAQRTLAKLESAIEQLRDQLQRMNRGEGSVGRILNDPVFADELLTALRNTNKLLSNVSYITFIIDLGAQYMRGYDDARGYFQLNIWPTPTRYYRLGIGVDPRGSQEIIEVESTAGGVTSSSSQTVTKPSGPQFTAMLGKTFVQGRLDLAAGVLHNNGAGSLQLNLGPRANVLMASVINDVYARPRSVNAAGGIDYRGTVRLRPLGTGVFGSVYLQAGLESLKRVNGDLPFFAGAGVSFSDEDIRLLFVLR